MTQPPDRHDPEDIDRRFQEIVDGLREPGPRPAPGPEVRKDDGAGPEQPDQDARGPHGDAAEVPRPASGRPPSPELPPLASGRARHLGPGTPEGMATDHRSYEPPEDEDDDHFVPPPPPPLPAGDLHFWAIVGGLVLGPLLVALSAIIPLLDPVWTTVGALLTLAGFVLLVLRLPRHRGDGDWGAKV